MSQRLVRGQITTAQLADYCDAHGIAPGVEFELTPKTPENVCARCSKAVEHDGYREIVGYEPLHHYASAKGKSVSAQRRTGRRVCHRCVSRLRAGLDPQQESFL